MHHIKTWHLPNHISPPAPGALHLWRIDMDEPGGNLRNVLSADEKERAGRFLDQRDRLRFIRSRSALRIILARYLNITARKIVFGYGPQGKPFIQDPGSALSFNLSHAGNLALLAVTSGGTLGIDLEQVHHRSNMLAIGRRLFPAAAQQELEELQGAERDTAFFHYWTELEARLKAKGAGIFTASRTDGNQGLDTCHFVPEPGWIGAIAMTPPMPQPSQWTAYRCCFRQLAQ